VSELQNGTVESIHIAPRAEELPHPVDEVDVVAGEGIKGDRYFRDTGDGTFHEEDKHGQDLTLIEAEAIEGLAADTGIELGPGEARRNLVTRGVALNDLVGRRFTVGEVEAGRRLATGCATRAATSRS
jgi:MOSC domain-containing protein YiiM